MYEDFAQFYDELTQNADFTQRAEYIHSLLKNNGATDGILLDLACGTGTLAVEFEKKGYSVIGVDTSVAMLSVARDKAEENQSNILWLCQDMTELDLYGTIDCCICTLDSLNHLIDEEDFVDAVSKVSLFMNPGGVFVFDVNTEYKHREILGDNSFVYETEDVFCVWQNQTDQDLITDIQLDFFVADGENYYRTTEEFSERAYSTDFIKNTLEKCGFENIHFYEELTNEAPKNDTQRIFCTAVKANSNG